MTSPPVAARAVPDEAARAVGAAGWTAQAALEVALARGVEDARLAPRVRPHSRFRKRATHVRFYWLILVQFDRARLAPRPFLAARAALLRCAGADGAHRDGRIEIVGGEEAAEGGGGW